MVPESSVRPSQDNVDHHTGRGGAGNEHIASHEAPSPSSQEHPRKVVGGEVAPVSLADKWKRKLVGIFKKK
jgi:hypothetical protein